MARQPDPAVTFSQWLAVQMRAFGYESDLALASELEVNGSTVGRWRHGKATPDVAQLRKLADLFRTPLPRLLVLAGHMTSEELGGAEPPEVEQVVDPTVELISRATIAPEMRRVLLQEWHRQLHRSRAQMKQLVNVAEGRLDVDWYDPEHEHDEFITVLMAAAREFGRLRQADTHGGGNA
ncbi:helix-turn-helix domain-containing protein [Jiangella endophytica]|uniref:helix-turn-helix domain-containing protein n=1 Tax=Jiangella endophytica TaxID=1623398 RepID=UPI000E34CBDC|nr:helix-turn-helix transcriptional regulator [Jiangella endophytica]